MTTAKSACGPPTAGTSSRYRRAQRPRSHHPPPGLKAAPSPLRTLAVVALVSWFVLYYALGVAYVVVNGAGYGVSDSPFDTTGVRSPFTPAGDRLLLCSLGALLWGVMLVTSPRDRGRLVLMCTGTFFIVFSGVLSILDRLSLPEDPLGATASVAALAATTIAIVVSFKPARRRRTRRTWRRLGIAMIVSGVAILAGTLAVARTSGPAFAELQPDERASLSGLLAFVTAQRDERCVRAGEARTQGRLITCEGTWWDSPIVFTNDGRLGVRTSFTGDTYVSYDPLSGERGSAIVDADVRRGLTRGMAHGVVLNRGWSADASNRSRGRVEIRVEGRDTKPLVYPWRGSRDFRIEGMAWSSDARWLVVIDSEARAILIEPAKPLQPPRVLARDVVDVSWFVPRSEP